MEGIRIDFTQNFQAIGFDCGAGNVKAYSKYHGRELKTIFRSARGLHIPLDFSIYPNAISIQINDGPKYLVGETAIIESEPTYCTSDSRANNDFFETMLGAVLNEIGVNQNIFLMVSVRDRNFTKKEMNALKEQYENTTMKIKNNINGEEKIFNIKGIMIDLEARSAFSELSRTKPDILSNRCAIVSLGARTVEIGMFRKGKYVQAESNSINLGITSALIQIEKELKREKIILELSEIDLSNEYDYLKEKQYYDLFKRITNTLETYISNINNIPIYVVGGTALELKKFVSEFDLNIVEDPLLTIAKGLYVTSTKIWS